MLTAGARRRTLRMRAGSEVMEDDSFMDGNISPEVTTTPCIRRCDPFLALDVAVWFDCPAARSNSRLLSEWYHWGRWGSARANRCWPNLSSAGPEFDADGTRHNCLEC